MIQEKKKKKKKKKKTHKFWIAGILQSKTKGARRGLENTTAKTAILI